MGLLVAGLVLGLAIILLSCELFTNGIEWLGNKLGLGDGVVGSVFSAVGTCLPETMIPVIAILFTDSSQDSVDIGIGAIVGAPFMLSTLAFFITGLSVILFRKRRKTGTKMKLNNKILSRDIGFFIIVYSIGIFAAFIESSTTKNAIALFLIICYGYYVHLTIKQDGHSHSSLELLLLTKYLKIRTGLKSILFQILIALAGIIFGAEVFVMNIEETSHMLGISVLVLSLIITPIATELPEKFNSIIWISKNKDTLALGNITGAMVFQSCIPVAIGISATKWNLDFRSISSAVLALTSGLICYVWIKVKGKLSPLPLLAGGGLYLVFITQLISLGFK